MHISK